MLVHPLAGLVTVRVYVPVAEIPVLAAVGVVPASVPDVGPVHSNVAPPVEELPESVTEVVVHVKVWSVPALTFGTVVFVVTATVPVFEQPFAGFVTVSVYVPAAVTFVLAEAGVEPAGVPAVGPVHAYVTPPVVELPDNVTVVVEQVMVWALPTFTFGSAPLVVTTAVPVFVHPFDGSVTVSV